MLYCGRYKDAEDTCALLLPGCDRLYLQAETAWRSGDPASAVTVLQTALEGCPDSGKCKDLLAAVGPLADLQTSAQGLLLEGEHAPETLETIRAEQFSLPLGAHQWVYVCSCRTTQEGTEF